MNTPHEGSSAIATSEYSMEAERSRRAYRSLDLIARYAAGEPVEDIAKHYGCAIHTVLRYARLAGLPKRPKHFPAETRKACINLYKAGRPIAEIAARLGVLQAYISKTATEEGINRRRFK